MRLRVPFAAIVSVLLFAALCAIVATWALKLFSPKAPIAPAGAIAQAQPPVDLSAASQLFGGLPRAASAVAAAPSNIQVAGVLAAGPRGVALLAIDGKPAKPFAVGESVSDGLTVGAVTGDAVELRGGAAPMKLAAPPRASLAVLTSGPQRQTDGMPPASATPISAPGAGPAPLPPRTLPPSGSAAVATPDPVAGGTPAQVSGAPPSFAPGAPPVPPPGVPPPPPASPR